MRSRCPFYFVISAPRSVSKGDIDKTLHELTADWKHPLLLVASCQRSRCE